MVGYRNVPLDVGAVALVYQAFRWWGIGTLILLVCNHRAVYQAFRWWGIGTSAASVSIGHRVYQAFRWWGIGTHP